MYCYFFILPVKYHSYSTAYPSEGFLQDTGRKYMFIGSDLCFNIFSVFKIQIILSENNTLHPPLDKKYTTRKRYIL